MKTWFNRPFILRTWHAALVLALALLGISGAVVWAQSGGRLLPKAPPPMFKPGTVRLSAVQYTSSAALTCDNTFQLAGAIGVKVPAGMKADVIATANAETFQTLGGGNFAYGKFVVDGVTDLAPASSGGMWLIDGSGPPYAALTQQGMSVTPLGPGNHTVSYMLRCTGGGFEIDDTILSGIVNLR